MKTMRSIHRQAGIDGTAVMSGCVALVHKDEGTRYGVRFPDLPGCISAGDAMDEALSNAAEMLAGHVALMRAEGDVIGKPRTFGAIRRDATLADGLDDAEVRVVGGRST